ncbi:MAG: PAS domain S-box protein, partial [Desulfobacterales bacterium]
MEQKKQIMIVEDDWYTAKDTKKILEDLGYEVSSIESTGESALEKIETLSPDLVLMDIVLKGQMDGIDTADQVHTRFNIPVVYVTAFADDKLLERARITEPFGYITKPFEKAELHTAIEIALYKHGTEEALRQSENKYRTILENMEEGYYEVDLSGSFTFVNDAMCRIRGMSRDELIGTNNRDYMAPETAKDVYKAFNKVYTTEEPARNLEWETLRPDGTRRQVETSASLIKDSGNKPTGFRGVVRDVTERRRTEEGLRESEERFRTAVINAPYQIMIHAEGGEVLQLSESWTAITGYAPEEIPTIYEWAKLAYGKNDLDEDAMEVINSVYKLRGRERQDDGIWPVIIKTGETRYWDFSTRPLGVDSDGRHLVISMAIDVTERKQAEDVAQSLRTRNELILSAAAEGIYGLDLEGNTTFVNPAALRMIGWELDDIIGKSQHQVLHHSRPGGTPYPPAECPIYATFKDGKEHHADDEVFWRKDGSCFPVEYNSRPIFNEDHKIEGAVVTFSDITERKQTEEERDRIFELTPDLIGVADANTGYFRRVNPAWEEVLGYSPEALTSRPFMDFIHPDDHNATAKKIGDQQSGESVLGFVNRYRCKDGSYRSIEWRATPAQSDGTVYAAGRDITERDSLERQLQQALKMEAIGTLSGGIAHDFNNMLGMILANAELTIYDLPEESPAHEYLQEIRNVCMRARDTVKQIQAFSRQTTQELQLVSIGPLVRETIKMLRASIPTTIDINLS